MFDFTTTTFIHSADMIEANPGSANHSGTGAEGTTNVLRLENKIFKAEDVVAIYKNPYVPASNAKLLVNVTKFMTDHATGNKRFKLDFYLKRSGDNNSYYSNDFVFKGKDFHYEWTDKQNTNEKVAKLINKINRLYGDVYLKVYVDQLDLGGGADPIEVLVFENDNYGIFTEASLKVYVPDEGDCCTYREGGWELIDELDTPMAPCAAVTCESPLIPRKTSSGGYLFAYQGVNGFGTYEQILKDLRLPTMENFRWTSLNASEMPVPGNLYTQYTIHQISCRGVLGGSAVGEVTHSKTTHVFFVPSCGCSDDDLTTVMDTAISDAGMSSLLVQMGPVVSAAVTPNPVDFESITYSSEKADTTTAGDHTAPAEEQGEP